MFEQDFSELIHQVLSNMCEITHAAIFYNVGVLLVVLMICEMNLS